MSKIAIDYDGTYSRFPAQFELVRSIFQKAGSKVFIVTARDGDKDPITDHDLSLFDDVIYCSYKAKAGIIDADIFIDDNPITLCCDMKVTPFIHAIPSFNLHQSYDDNIWNWHWSTSDECFIPEQKD